ncbi:MAG: HlyC/CorC family transporter, partial [Erysipelotrichaceae bacterium]|nr:HlyC/CorC family transporter [Erysipelotrichaceae bacterium]
MVDHNTIVLLILLVFLSGFFSATETAFSSASRIRLKYLAGTGSKRAEKTLAIVDDFTTFLSTVLIGNNVVNIFSASVATVLFTQLFQENGVFLSSLVMTIVVLIFGEIIPKTIAKQIPEKFAMAVTPVMSFLIFLLKPLTAIFHLLEKAVRKFFKEEEDDSYRSEEFITMVEDAQEDGDMDEHEADLITNAIEFNDLDVGEILTPRIDVIACDVTASKEEIFTLFKDSGFSRIPCYEGSVDNIIGVLHEKDFYFLYYTDTKTTVKQILQKCVYTSPHVKISALLRQLQSSKSHMAVVIDEYGGTEGIITMEDILEELVGEIYDEHDEVIEYYKKLDDKSYLVKGDLDIDDLFEHFDIK